MKCVRCSAEIPSQSQYCLRCGTSVRGTGENPIAGMTAPSADFASASRPNRAIPAVIGALTLLVIVLGALVVRGSLVQKPSNPAGSALVQAPTQAQPSTLVQAPTAPEPTTMVQAPTETAPKPVDVIDYLAFLKQVEVTKLSLRREQMSQLLPMLTTMRVTGGLHEAVGGAENEVGETPKLPTDQLSQKSKEIEERWNQLTKFFLERTPPNSCSELHAIYYKHLGIVQGQVLKINELVGKIQTDTSNALNGLMGMLEPTELNASDEEAAKADRALAEVCKRFNLTKDFEIRVDPPGAGLGGLFR